MQDVQNVSWTSSLWEGGEMRGSDSLHCILLQSYGGEYNIGAFLQSEEGFSTESSTLYIDDAFDCQNSTSLSPFEPVSSSYNSVDENPGLINGENSGVEVSKHASIGARALKLKLDERSVILAWNAMCPSSCPVFTPSLAHMLAGSTNFPCEETFRPEASFEGCLDGNVDLLAVQKGSMTPKPHVILKSNCRTTKGARRKSRTDTRRASAERRPRYKGRFVTKEEMSALITAGVLGSNDAEDIGSKQEALLSCGQE